MLINKVNKQLTYLYNVTGIQRYLSVTCFALISHCITEREREKSVSCLGIVDQEISTYTG